MTNADYFAQGMIKVKENDHQGAIDLFTQVLKADPKNANAYSQRAICYLNLDQLDLSLSDMNKAVEYDPEYSFRYQSRGYLRARLKDYEGAIKDYEKAVELDPDDAIAYNNLALAQEQMGWAQQAKENFDKSDTIQGIKTGEERAAERREKAEQAQEAIATNETSTEEGPSKGEIAKSVFTKKDTFKEFIQFIKNGFKLKQDDES
mgnify:CR=1 FL=1